MPAPICAPLAVAIGCYVAPMRPGRFIRVGKYRGDPKMVAYIVAITDPAAALELIKAKVATLADDVNDMGRVSEALLVALRLSPGDFVRADGASASKHDPENPER